MADFGIPVFRGRDKKRIIIFGEKDNIIDLVKEFQRKGTYVNEYISDDEIANMKKTTLLDLTKVSSREYLLVVTNGKQKEKHIEEIKRHNLDYYTIDMLSHFYDDRPLKACHMKMMSIDRNGDIYPCCKIIDKIRIGNICEDDIVSKIKEYGDNKCSCGIARLRPATNEEFSNGIERLAMELCGPCQADCTYCYEKSYTDYNKPFKYTKELENFINKIKCKQIVAFGGELLCQKNILDMFKRIKSINPNILIDVPTNGNFDLQILDKIENVFNDFEISFSGFSESTYKTIMNLDLNKTKNFVLQLDKRKINSYILKMLLSPICIAEMNVFLKWALSLNPSHIVFHIADVYKQPYQCLTTEQWEGDSFSGKNELYWEPLLERIRSEFEQIIIKNKDKIIEKNINIVLPNKVIYLLHISDDFWQKNGLEQNFGAKSTMILNGV